MNANGFDAKVRVKDFAMANAKQKKTEPALIQKNLLAEIREIISGARFQVARVVDAGLVTLYWNIGRRIRQDILKEQKAEHGEQIVSSQGAQLEREFGRGFSEKSIRHMIRFFEIFPNEAIVSSLRRQLSWTHFKRFIYIAYDTDLPEIPGHCPWEKPRAFYGKEIIPSTRRMALMNLFLHNIGDFESDSFVSSAEALISDTGWRVDYVLTDPLLYIKPNSRKITGASRKGDSS